MSAGLASTDQDPVQIILFDTVQATQVSDVSVNGKGAGDDLDAALPRRFLAQAVKLVGNPATTLSQANDN
jgi:hypothetical protein